MPRPRRPARPADVDVGTLTFEDLCMRTHAFLTLQAQATKRGKPRLLETVVHPRQHCRSTSDRPGRSSRVCAGGREIPSKAARRFPANTPGPATPQTTSHRDELIESGRRGRGHQPRRHPVCESTRSGPTLQGSLLVPRSCAGLACASQQAAACGYGGWRDGAVPARVRQHVQQVQ